ncbi:MAG: hypothetical protein JXB48_13640 [Candidatus Latescibacteria bacterium]|nr:hypothetical protein [Candidatus Latescibacterota bacterium]
MSKESIYFHLGKRIGYWYASNRHNLHRKLIAGLLSRIPGGKWLSRFM